MRSPNTVYALYKGDEFIGVGTAEELAEMLGVKPSTVDWYSYPIAKQRNKGKCKIAIILDDEE